MTRNQQIQNLADLQKQFIDVVNVALKEQRRNYCVPCRAKNARLCYTINWDIVDKVYGCAVLRFQSEPHVRRILVLPGAVIYLITDGPNSWCYTAGEIFVAKDILSGWFREMYIFQDGDIEKAKAICMR